jgi:hypothetical protein
VGSWADGLLRMMHGALATESGCSGELFRARTVAFGPQLGRGPAETMGHYRSPVVNKSAGHNPLHRVAAARKLAGLSLIRMKSEVQLLPGPPTGL